MAKRVFTRAVVGATGGLAATWAMTQVQTQLSKAMKKAEQSSKEGHDATIIQAHEQWEERQKVAQGQADSGQKQSEPRSEPEAEASTTKLANRVVYLFTGHELEGSKKAKAGTYVHYSMGAWLGLMYAMLAPKVSLIRSGKGVTYGALAWLLNDDLLLPSLHLAGPPTKTPGKMHAYALTSHLAYGVSLYSLIGWMPFLKGPERSRSILPEELDRQREKRNQTSVVVKTKKRPKMVAFFQAKG